jgi:hypothetical protein
MINAKRHEAKLAIGPIGDDPPRPVRYPVIACRHGLTTTF